MSVKVDRCAVRIRFGDNTQTVLKVLDVCAFFESFQNASSRETRLAIPARRRHFAESSQKNGPQVWTCRPSVI
jgi:hypothetical protein